MEMLFVDEQEMEIVEQARRGLEITCTAIKH